MNMSTKQNYKLGMISALLCAFLWGILPIYWKMLLPIPSVVIIFYRIVLVGVFSLVVVLIKYPKEKIISNFKNKKQLLLSTLAGILITLNWSIYIWAVNKGFVIQTTIGYYMEPLFVSFLGIVIFKERFHTNKKIAFFMALIGLSILIIHFREVPIISLGLALSFAFYSAIKKKLKMDSFLSLFFETLILSMISLIVIIYLEVNSIGAINVSTTPKYILLLMCGFFTALPLALFSYAANNLSLITLGITEYLSPSIALLLGIFLFKEPFDIMQLYSFIIIWIGLVIFTIGEIHNKKCLR